MSTKRRFFNMYVTTAISIAMVLFLLGLEVVMLLSTHSLMNNIRDNVTMTIVLAADADSVNMRRLSTTLDVVPYTESYTYVTKEQALQEHIAALGEDPTEFLGYNPLRDAYELQLADKYVQADSMAHIAAQLQALPYVEKVVYQKDLLEFMSANLSQAAWILLGVALILLIIAQALIINTIRLQIYSKRFLIRTMTLVGATAATIKRPFVGKNMLIGIVAAVLALAALAGTIYYVNYKLGVVLFPLTWQNLCLIAGIVIGLGLIIVVMASLIATGRYIRMKGDKLYEI